MKSAVAGNMNESENLYLKGTRMLPVQAAAARASGSAGRVPRRQRLEQDGAPAGSRGVGKSICRRLCSARALRVGLGL